MEEEIKKCYCNASITKVKSSGGIFEIIVNDITIFSKNKCIGTKEPRFPYEGEIIKLIKKVL